MQKNIIQSIFITIVSCCFYLTSFCQFIIKGKVTNSQGANMPAASVFAQNTTIGTSTDAEGNFTLQLPNGGYDVAFSYTGHQTITKRITAADANDFFTIVLPLQEKSLEEVAVVSTNEVKNGFEKYGQFFLEEFIGKTENAKQCQIKNPEILKFFFSKKKNKLRVMAAEPLIIDNNALGYTIKYALDSFVYEYNTDISFTAGYPQYQAMQADSMQQAIWSNARALAYKGSSLHFMRSLYKKTLAEEKFAIQFIIKANNEKDKAIPLKDFYAALNYSFDDSTQTVEILPNQQNVGILYLASKPAKKYLEEFKGEPSEFRFTNFSVKKDESLVIESNGFYYDQNDVTISGYWMWERLADQLPYDYVN
jgi:hypothetical protein